MKRTFILLLALVLVAMLAACGGNDSPAEPTDEPTAATTEPTEPTAAPTAVPAALGDRLQRGTPLGLYDSTDEVPYYNTAPAASRQMPKITFYPPKEKTSDECVIVCPGGSYWSLWKPGEGSDIALALNNQGVTAVVLDYRIAQDGYHYEAMLTDVFRAIRFIRYYADEMGVNPNKIVTMGFSAGGHLATMSLEHWDDEIVLNNKVDAIDEMSSRPDAGVICYGVQSFTDATLCHTDSRKNFLGAGNLTDELKQKFSGEQGVRADMPPAYIWHNKGDTVVPVGNAIALDEAMTAAGVEHDLLLFEGGSHGGGLWTGKTQQIWLYDSLDFLEEVLA